MPRNDRRNAHRYAGQGQDPPWLVARSAFPNHLRAVAESQRLGALVQLEEGAVGPAGVKAWICLADQSATHWVQAEVVEVCPELPERRVWCGSSSSMHFLMSPSRRRSGMMGSARGMPAWPDADDTPPPCQDETSARPTNPVAMTQRERILFFLQLDAENVKSSDRGPEIVALASPHPPTLLQAYRSQMVSADKVASFPWVVVLLVSLSARSCWHFLPWDT